MVILEQDFFTADEGHRLHPIVEITEQPLLVVNHRAMALTKDVTEHLWQRGFTRALFVGLHHDDSLCGMVRMLDCERTPTDQVVKLRAVASADDLFDVLEQSLHQLAALPRLDCKISPE